MARKIISLFLAGACSWSHTAFGQTATGLHNPSLVAAYGHDYWALERVATRMRRARTVTLYLVSPHFWPMRALDEGRLKQAACEYTTTDAALIASLADVVEDAHLHSATTWISIEPREAIYLTLGGGSEIRLLFDRAYQNQPELAGSVDGQVVMVRSSFVEMLYRWAAKLNSLGTCEHFLDKYR